MLQDGGVWSFAVVMEEEGGNLGEGERGGEIWIKWEEQRGYTNQMKSITSLCNLIGHVVKHHDLKLFVTFV